MAPQTHPESNNLVAKKQCKFSVAFFKLVKWVVQLIKFTDIYSSTGLNKIFPL